MKAIANSPVVHKDLFKETNRPDSAPPILPGSIDIIDENRAHNLFMAFANSSVPLEEDLSFPDPEEKIRPKSAPSAIITQEKSTPVLDRDILMQAIANSPIVHKDLFKETNRPNSAPPILPGSIDIIDENRTHNLFMALADSSVPLEEDLSFPDPEEKIRPKSAPPAMITQEKSTPVLDLVAITPPQPAAPRSFTSPLLSERDIRKILSSPIGALFHRLVQMKRLTITISLSAEEIPRCLGNRYALVYPSKVVFGCIEIGLQKEESRNCHQRLALPSNEIPLIQEIKSSELPDPPASLLEIPIAELIDSFIELDDYEKIRRTAMEKYKSLKPPLSTQETNKLLSLTMRDFFTFLMNQGLLEVHVKKGISTSVFKTWRDFEYKLLTNAAWTALVQSSNDVRLSEVRSFFHETLIRTLLDHGYITCRFKQ